MKKLRILLNAKISKAFFPVIAVLFWACESPPPERTEIENTGLRYKFTKQIREDLEISKEPWKYQVAAWDYSYIGEYEEMLKTWDQEHDGEREVNQALLDSFTTNFERVTARDFIVSQADSTQIVIINEAHHQPLHRVFTAELLADLYGKGYRYLGLETLQKSDTELNSRGYPIFSSGTYSIEPQFGNLIRGALAMGYTLFAYESDGNGTEREIGQAKNIQSQFQKDSTSKYLIHCGFAHAAEGEYKSWGKAMAGRVQEFMGINPLTINQTEFTEKSRKGLENPVYQDLEIPEPSVFLDGEGNSFKHASKPEWFDIMVFHPRTKMEAGRPDWLFRNKKKVEIDVKSIELKRPFFAMAFKGGEDYENAVPCDIIEFAGEDEKGTLALEAGIYNIIYHNGLDKPLLEKREVE